MEKIKSRLYNIIRDDDVNGTAGNVFDGVIISLIILNVFMVVADTFSLPVGVRSAFRYAEIVSVVIFTVEYLLRVCTSSLMYENLPPFKARLKYIFSFMALIDLFAILPFYLPYLMPVDLRVLRALRVVRLFRLFKINRYTSALLTIGRVFRRKASQLVSSVSVVFLLMVIASVLMYNAEHEAQPDAFANAFSALWWAVSTLTTVGYGDIFPVTAAGKLLGGVVSLLGIGLVAVPTGIISAGFMEQSTRSDGKKTHCPYCGHKLD